MSGNHPDLIYVTHEKPGSIGVDDVAGTDQRYDGDPSSAAVIISSVVVR